MIQHDDKDDVISKFESAMYDLEHASNERWVFQRLVYAVHAQADMIKLLVKQVEELKYHENNT